MAGKMIEDWDDILQQAGFDAGYKTAIKEFLEDLTLNHPMVGFKYTRQELIEKWKKKCLI